MQSTCSRSASPATRSTSAASSAKSAARMDGAIFTDARLMDLPSLSFEGEDEHAIGIGIGGQEQRASPVGAPRRTGRIDRVEPTQVPVRPIVDTNRLGVA